MRIQIWYLFYPGSGMEKFGPGINIPDPQHWLQALKSFNFIFAMQIKRTVPHIASSDLSVTPSGFSVLWGLKETKKKKLFHIYYWAQVKEKDQKVP
jgi:hypothetical protein